MSQTESVRRAVLPDKVPSFQSVDRCAGCGYFSYPRFATPAMGDLVDATSAQDRQRITGQLARR
jgi:pyruvate/2-oxoacid:ferredoxin oxidoreductase beta subunit